MTHCPFCQTENVDGSRMCSHCLQSLELDVALDIPPQDLILTPVTRISSETASESSESKMPSTVRLNSVPLVEKTEMDRTEARVKPGSQLPVSPFGPGSSVTADPFPAFPPEARTHRLNEGISVVPPTMTPTTGEAPAPGQLPPAPVTMPVSALNQQATSPPPTTVVPTNVRPKLIVLRGERVNVQYAIYEGKNFLGRTDEKPVDIDLENQEPADRIWTSRQHAVITFENGALFIEDLNSLNGTFVNRTRVHPGQLRPLQVNDIIQVGTVQMKLVLS